MNKSTSYNIPTKLQDRDILRKLISEFAIEKNLKPPISLNNLSDLCDNFITNYSSYSTIKPWLMVELNNQIWKPIVASIPYERRILLLPQCLSNKDICSAEIDEIGLLCHQCNNCIIPNFEDIANSMGMMCIVAEGFTPVIKLIQNKVVDAVIGVGCLESLEKAFPLLINNAIPGVAIPLNNAGCKYTDVDYEYVKNMICMDSEDENYLLDYDNLKSSIERWFSEENIKKELSNSNEQTSNIAHRILSEDGGKWRPYLLASIYLSLTGEQEAPKQVELAAIAIECFHKASLVHDDIQDNDKLRYGKPTLHETHGTAIAINTGDLLIGEGYRLLTKCNDLHIIDIVTKAHISLCKGQGMELQWSKSPQKLSLDFVLEIFNYKTVPAFEVAIVLGLICTKKNNELLTSLKEYSKALGIAFQLKDDLEDFENDKPIEVRPSAILASICEQNLSQDFIQSLLKTNNVKELLLKPENKKILADAIDNVKKMSKKYHSIALDEISKINNVELKKLLFRVTEKILK
jgi:geranylgeranyl diphosphate synthase, type II